MKFKLKILSLVLIAVLMCAPLSASSAYLVHSPAAVNNSFTGSYIDLAVSYSSSTSPVGFRIQNNGNAKSWVRVIVDVNWTNEDDDNWIATGGTVTDGRLIYGVPPFSSSGTYPNGMPYTADYAMTDYTADGNWIKGNEDGVYYYTNPVFGGGGLTPAIIKSFTVYNSTITKSVQGKSRVFQLTVDVSVDGIQYENPANLNGNTPAVVSEWGVTLNSDGTKIIAAPAADFAPTF